MRHRGSGWKNRIVIEPEELDTMQQMLHERKGCDRLEMSFGEENSDVMFYYGVMYKPEYDGDIFDDDDFEDLE